MAAHLLQQACMGPCPEEFAGQLIDHRVVMITNGALVVGVSICKSRFKQHQVLEALLGPEQHLVKIPLAQIEFRAEIVLVALLDVEPT